ncbi:hypothetical protein Gotri_021247, partial [Gossypium trilobum]|nr:hypothetical protein [Gossypium trilobum]
MRRSAISYNRGFPNPMHDSDCDGASTRQPPGTEQWTWRRVKASRVEETHVRGGAARAEEALGLTALEVIGQSEPTDCFEWLIWVFSRCLKPQRRLFVCGIWVLWLDRNKNLYERKSYSGIEAANYVKYFICELDGLTERKINTIGEKEKWKAPENPTIKINFDASFDKAIACYEAILTGIDMGLIDVIVKGDSKSIINKCMKKSVDKSQISAHIRNIQKEK